MALTQMQLIQSLGEAMAWFERELQWGVAPTELRHLCGRIGELYAALVSNGQLAQQVNQRGYDVVGGNGERISVKTTAMMTRGGHISFNPRSLDVVDRVMVLRLNTDEMQIETLLDVPTADLLPLLAPNSSGTSSLALSKLLSRTEPVRRAATALQLEFAGYVLRELESGTIEIEHNGVAISPVKPVLRDLAMQLHVPLINGKGNDMNTRQLGAQVMHSIRALQGSAADTNATLTQD